MECQQSCLPYDTIIPLTLPVASWVVRGGTTRGDPKPREILLEFPGHKTGPPIGVNVPRKTKDGEQVGQVLNNRRCTHICTGECKRETRIFIYYRQEEGVPG